MFATRFMPEPQSFGRPVKKVVQAPMNRPNPDEEGSSRPSAEEVPGGKETLLLVEDESLILRNASRALRNKGYTVHTASNGNDALEIFQREQTAIAMVITDVIMPGLNGRQLADALHAEVPDLPTLFMSGYPEEVIARHGIIASDISFLEKPFSSRTLLQKVREMLDLPR